MLFFFQYAPLKTHSLSLSERARKLGLAEHAEIALNGGTVFLHKLCDKSNEELSTPEKVDTHLTHIVADIISKNTRVLDQIRVL